MQDNLQKILIKSQNPKLIGEVFYFAEKAYQGKIRASGENYLHHAMRVALMLSEMNIDATTISLAILHDILDDSTESARKIQLHEIEKYFGKELAELVEKISKLSIIRYPLKNNGTEKFLISKNKTENLRKMFLAIAGDLRVVLVELISRLDGLNYVHTFSDDKKKMYSFETLQIFAPVANRLGLNEIRRKLEDISFSYLFPEKYKWLRDNLQEEYDQREKYLESFIPRLEKIFKKERIEAIEISYRTKSYWSTYKKLLKKDMDLKKIHDLFALRVIVKDIPSCYKSLGVIHKYYKPISEEINDYIAKPKSSGYRSLHTTIYSAENKITEIQIRTSEMHKEAEFGVCAHWSYKENVNLKKDDKKFEWMQEASQFWKTFKINFFENQVFTLTPKGDIIVLKKDSTPIDFAYAIHSEIGNHCESAKINGKIATISDKLKNGDIIEIITNKKKDPSLDWIRFVKTGLAKNQIEKTLAKKESYFRIPVVSFVKEKIIEIAQTARKKNFQKEQIRRDGPRHIFLAGQKGMMVTLAKCCKPEPGDKVKAYLSKYRSAVLHRINCKEFKNISEKFPEKVIDADWK